MVDREQKQVEKEKKQLPRVMKKNPDHFKTVWTEALGWVNSKNKVDQTKIIKRLKRADTQNDLQARVCRFITGNQR